MNWHGTLLTSGSTVPKFYFLSTLPLLCPGFQVRGGGAPKKIAPSGGRRENYLGISCEKSRFYAKKIIFFPILGGEPGAPPPSPWIRPWIQSIYMYICTFSLQEYGNIWKLYLKLFLRIAKMERKHTIAYRTVNLMVNEVASCVIEHIVWVPDLK